MRMRAKGWELALPFALVGAAAGWISAGVLASPMVNVALGGKQEVAAICAGIVGGLIGALLPRVVAPRQAWHGRGPAWASLAALVLPGGALAGAVIALVTVRNLHGAVLFAAVTGAVNGLICAAATLPICGAVLEAALRAERARLGSIVAASDRRAVWQILAASIAVATLAALPEWPAARIGRAPPPQVAEALALGAWIAVGLLILADAAALGYGLHRAAGAPERCSPDAIAPDPAVPRVDLGLGDDVHARLARGDAYRGRDRASLLVIGSHAEAHAALAGALRRGVVCFALGAAVLFAHRWAAGPSAVDAYHTARCALGHVAFCASAEEPCPRASAPPPPRRARIADETAVVH
ncbi:hypothetical protein [Sorangium sp. So ce1335]|uniref:hypothetical protein n=1 Tax=Sorangium sp. So ce1335 TaxID=3133335 RepID=UPI003F5E2C54